MNLHEYQGKEILNRFNIRTQKGFLATTQEEAISNYEKIVAESNSPFAIVKAQIHAG